MLEKYMTKAGTPGYPTRPKGFRKGLSRNLSKEEDGSPIVRAVVL
jgi:hypothetical protein